MGCILGMPEIPPFVFIVAAIRYMGFLELNKCFFKRGCFRCGRNSKVEGPKRSRPFFAFRQKSLFIPGCVQDATIEFVCVYVCVTFVLFTDCDSCTRPISTNPVSMEAGEYGLTRGTCFFARRLEVVAVAGLLRLSWCVLGGVDFFAFFSRLFFLFERARPTASMSPPLASFTSLLVPGCVQGAII